MADHSPSDPATDPSSDLVAQQFTRWTYPHPAIGVAHRLVWNDPGTYGPLYWPHGAPTGASSGPLTLLVAGCGTSEAVALAHNSPHARVIGVDISRPALQESAALAQRLGVTNLELHPLPLEHIHQLNEQFDFITVAGVLHHLADPALGLRALGSVLKPHGVIVGAVYAHAARRGIELVQATLRDLNIQQTPADIALARSTLAALPDGHPARPWLNQTGDIWQFDNHIVDTWLPARETCYDPAGVHTLIHDAGLTFQGWFNNAPYEPDHLLPPEHPLYARLMALPQAKRWQAMTRISVPQDHTFIACRADRPVTDWQLPGPQSPRLLDLTPSPRLPPHPKYPPMPYDPRQPLQAAFYRHIDGQHTIREILAQLPSHADPAWLTQFARDFIGHLWRKDAIFLTFPLRA
jgi:SAM-dependent methyltransferase